jgi:inhibitor of cysteine peptidase
MGQILIDQDDNNKTFDAKLGDLIIITIKESPTTGYRWKLGRIDEGLVVMEDSKYHIDPDSRIGGGGTRTFTIRVRSPGTTKIQLTHQREWENSAINQFVVFIRIT